MIINENKLKLLLEEYTVVKISGGNKKHYVDLGYSIDKGQRELKVRIIDLPKYSEKLIRVKCELCSKETTMTWYNFNRFNKIMCEECSPHRNKTLVCQFCGEETHRTHENGLGICGKHRSQILKYGHVIQGRYDKNDYVFEGDYVKIILQSHGEILEDFAIIDKDDYEKVKGFRWHLENSYGDLKYVADCSDGVTKRLHNVIMGKHDDCIIDHINGNGLDNRKENLRIATFSENSINTKARKDNKLGLKNILQQSKNSYRVAIQFNGETIIKSFTDLNEAINFRDNFYKENDILSRHYEED